MNRTIKTVDELYEEIYEDEEEDAEKMEEFKIKLDELIKDGAIERGLLQEDFHVFFSNKKSKRYEINKMDDDIKKKILFYLLDNNNVFFVIKNTQEGKTGIMINDVLIPASKNKDYKIVPYIFADNNKDLAQQLKDAIESRFKQLNIPHTIFLLSSNEKNDFERAMWYIDLYGCEKFKEKPKYPMPIYICLSNNNQCERILQLMNQVNKNVKNDDSILRNLAIWDEADKTYPPLRDKEFLIDGEMISCKTLMVDNTDALQNLWFFSATEGPLIDSEILDWQYPECANAQIHHTFISPESKAKYRALHHPDAVTHRIPYTSRHTNNSYAMDILLKYKKHFMNPITLPTGDKYFRKTIVNSNNKTKDMDDFAKEVVKMGMYALVFNGLNGTSIKIYRGDEVIVFKTLKRTLNQTLFYIYKMFNLNDKPLILLGRRKVDRGLGFHYPVDKNENVIDLPEGKLVTYNKEGLIWTDMILGSIKDKNTAVQKAGRLAGNIGDSPQYPGKIDFWTNKETEQLIREHNMTVDLVNTMEDVSISEALSLAKTMVKKGETISTFEEFNSMDEANKRWKTINPHGNDLREPNKDKETGKYKCSIGDTSETYDINEVRDKVGGTSMAYWGAGYTGAKNGDIIHRVYVGYDNDIPVYALRWAKVIEEEEQED